MNLLIQHCLNSEFAPLRLNVKKNLADISLFKNEIHCLISDCKVNVLRSSEFVDNMRLDFFVKFTEMVLSSYQMNDLSFEVIVNFNDGPQNDSEETRFCFARPRHSPHICIPDSHLFKTISICNAIENIDIEFDKKLNTAVFFGSDTGAHYNNSVQRINLCRRYKNSDLVKAKITNFVEFPFEDEISAAHTSIQDQLKHKYILNINGNTTSWERLIWALKSNSVCLFVRPPSYQDEISWYYHIFDLVQGVLYVDEYSIESFVKSAGSDEKYIQSIKTAQKNLANYLDKIDVHAFYYSEVLKKYNSFYNES